MLSVTRKETVSVIGEREEIIELNQMGQWSDKNCLAKTNMNVFYHQNHLFWNALCKLTEPRKQFSNSHCVLFSRQRRRSGSSIVVVGGDDSLKNRYQLDDYLSDTNNPADVHQYAQGTHHHHHQLNSDIEMLTMLSVNQNNGEWAECSGIRTPCLSASNNCAT